MNPPVRMEPSVPSAVPSREALALLRILVVAGEGGSAGGLLQNLRQWADDGRLEIDTAPDLPRAVRQLAGQRWDLVLAVLGEHPDDDLSWWVDTLRGATGSPRLIAVAQAPSMGLVLRAEKSGVLDVPPCRCDARSWCARWSGSAPWSAKPRSTERTRSSARSES